MERLAESGQVESVSRYVTEAVAFRHARGDGLTVLERRDSASHRTTLCNGPAPSSHAASSHTRAPPREPGLRRLGARPPRASPWARVEPYAQSLVWSAMEVGMAVAVPIAALALACVVHSWAMPSCGVLNGRAAPTISSCVTGACSARRRSRPVARSPMRTATRPGWPTPSTATRPRSRRAAQDLATLADRRS